jgi:hypothetical protein
MWSSHSPVPRGAGAVSDAAVLAVSGHLTGRDRLLIRAVAEHRVLTTGQLCALAFDSLITARHRLAVLVRLGLLRRFRPRRDVGSAPCHYLLGPVGAALLGAEDRDERKWLPQVRADRQLALERSQRLAHMTGANWFFVALARHARTHGGDLSRWMGERATADWLYGFGSQPGVPDGRPHPDGMGIWAEDGTDLVFVLEYDTGTEHLPILVGKLAAYGELARTHPGAHPVRVPLLFCFPGPRREQSARRALAASPHAHLLQIATAAFDPEQTSPAGQVWLPLADGHERPMRLIDLGAVMPDPWRAARDHPDRQPHGQTNGEPAGDPDGPDDPYGP